MKTSHKFATATDISVPRGKNSVANATTLVAILGPGYVLSNEIIQVEVKMPS